MGTKVYSCVVVVVVACTVDYKSIVTEWGPKLTESVHSH